MATKRYTEPQNIRFERHIVKLIDDALESDWCTTQGFNRSDLIRHLVRVGLHNFQRNQPKNREFITPIDRDIPDSTHNNEQLQDLFETRDDT